MSLRTILVIAAIYVLFLIGLTQVDAASSNKVKIKTISKGQFVADTVIIEAVQDAGAGKIALLINACGTLLEFTTDESSIINQDKEVGNIIGTTIDKACK